jgi:4-amino-4-deoxy-L-arabinose transferase-like glycosyltransferase
MNGALFVMALSAGAAIVLVFLLVAELGGRGAALLTVALIMGTSVLVRLHTAIWSEPLFIPLMLAAVYGMVRRPARPLFVGVCVAAATLVRYVGLSLVVVGLGWALFGRRRGRARLRRALLAIGPTLAGLGWWALYVATGRGEKPGLAYQRGWTEVFREAPAEVSAWLSPSIDGRVGVVIAALVAVAGVAVVGGAIRRLGREGGLRGRVEEWDVRAQYFLIVACIAVGFAGIVLVSRIFVDPWIPLSARIFSPLIVLFEISFAVALAIQWPRLRHALRAVVVAVIVAWLVLSSMEIVRGVDSVRQNGRFYSAGVWRASPVLRWVSESGSICAIFSNEPELIYLYTRRHARRLPAFTDFDVREALGKRISAVRGVVVLIAPLRRGELTPDAFLRGMDFRLKQAAPEGAVLIPPDPSCAG